MNTELGLEDRARLFQMSWTIAADSLESLRKCDVYRVLEAALNQGNLTYAMNQLAKARPDLKPEIEDVIQEMVQKTM
jgi:hypothetical protein